MTKIFCKCCNRPLEIKGAHEFKSLPACKNQVRLEGRPGKDGSEGFPRITALNYALVLLWNGEAYEPLVQEAPAKPKKKKRVA